MERLKLSNGLIAIGFGGSSNIEQTKFSLKLANDIAQNENVLFLNWNNYSKKLNEILLSLNVKKSKKLEINTNVNYFGVDSFLDIIELIEQKKFTTIFIDNTSSFSTKERIIDEYGNRETLLKAFTFLSIKYSVRIVFNIQIDPEIYNYSFNIEENEIDLGYFRWSRRTITECNQVIAVQNIEGYMDGETGEIFESDTFKVFNLKNDNDIIENYIVRINKP